MRLAMMMAGVLFLVVPALELWILIVLNRHMGLGPTLGLLVLTGVAGFWLARWQGWRAFRRIQDELAAGRLPSAAVMDGVLILLAGVLLITPGLITDVTGFLLLLPTTRYLLRRALVGWFRRHTTGRVVFSGAATPPGSGANAGTVEGRAVSVEDADGRSPAQPAGGTPGRAGER